MATSTSKPASQKLNTPNSALLSKRVVMGNEINPAAKTRMFDAAYTAMLVPRLDLRELMGCSAKYEGTLQ